MKTSIGVFSAYSAFWRHYADFRSRTSREAFWKAWVIHAVIVLALVSPLYYVYYQIIENGDLTANLWLIPVWVYSLATIIPTIAIIIRRLQDIDRSGGWFFLFLIPFVGQIIFFIMLVRPSAPFDVYPGISGKGPYTDESRRQHIMPLYAWQPYAQPYPGQQPYAQQYPGQQPYAQPYAGQPYAQYPQYPYGAPYYGPAPAYSAPLPAARKFKPAAGVGKALGAVVVSAIIMVVFIGYNIASDDYLKKNYDKYFEAFFGNFYSDLFSLPYDGYDYWGDLWGNNWNDEWGYYPYDNQDNGGDGYGWYDTPDYDYDLTEEELAAIDTVRGSSLPGFPDFTIEEVLLPHTDQDGLSWDCFYDEDGGEGYYYVFATGYLDGSFVMLYAGFDLLADGTIELYNLDDGARDEYGENAIKLYAEWYNSMLSKTHENSAA